MGLLDQFKAYIQANTPRATTPRVSPAKVINKGLLNPNEFNAPAANRFKDSLFGMMGVVPGVGDVASGVQAADFWNRGEKLNAGLSALGALPFIPTLHTVYHGSPHKFNKFDMSKIGTGEGAQAYGHGLYFAESPGVANSYVTNPGGLFTVKGKTYGELQKQWGEFDKPTRRALTALADSQGNADEAIGNLKGMITPESNQAADVLKQWVDSGDVLKNTGNMYKVDIPDEAIPRMLDWDKPLSEQPHILDSLLRGDNEYQQYALQLSPEMRKIADDMVTGKLPVHSDDISGTWQPLLDNYPNLDHNAIHDVRYRLFPETDDLDWLSGVLSGSSKPGSGVRGGGGADLYNSIGHERLKELGIPGIRYLDGSSRNVGEGTSNFVIFDDQLPRILEINGQPTGLLSYADEAKKAQESKGLLNNAPTPKDYGMEHRPPMRDSGAPLHDLTGGGTVYPDDIYSSKATQYYGTGDTALDRKTMRLIQSYKDNPDAPVVIYRAVSKEIPEGAKINAGDWVTINPDYAKMHGESTLNGEYRIIKQQVKAKDIYTNGDSIHEFGFDPD